MATTGIAPIKQALVRALRDNQSLKDLVGADGINEGTEPRNATYPYIAYSVTHTAREWDSTSVTLISDVDVWSVSDQQVVAHSLDQLVADALEDVVLDFSAIDTQQTSLSCRRIGDLSSFDVEPGGKRVFQMCGVYRIWTSQPRTA